MASLAFKGEAGTTPSRRREGSLKEQTGWGVAARVSIGADGSLSGHGLQYDPGVGGYRDVDYPSNTGPSSHMDTDGNWHRLAVTVRGQAYELRLDGRIVAQGALAQAVESEGGVFVRVWSGSSVELRNLSWG